MEIKHIESKLGLVALLGASLLLQGCASTHFKWKGDNPNYNQNINPYRDSDIKSDVIRNLWEMDKNRAY